MTELEMPPMNTARTGLKLQDRESLTAGISIFPLFAAAAGSAWRIKVLGVTGAD